MKKSFTTNILGFELNKEKNEKVRGAIKDAVRERPEITHNDICESITALNNMVKELNAFFDNKKGNNRMPRNAKFAKDIKDILENDTIAKLIEKADGIIESEKTVTKSRERLETHYNNL